MKSILPYFKLVPQPRTHHANAAKLPLPPKYLRPFFEVDARSTMAYPEELGNSNGGALQVGVIGSQDQRRRQSLTGPLHAVDTNAPSSTAGPAQMTRYFGPIALAAIALAGPAFAQTTSTPAQPAKPPAAAPANPAQSATTPQQPAAPGAPQTGAVPLPTWFNEIDTQHKGYVTREEFVKYRMKTFEQLDVNHDGKLTLDEFVKVAEEPFSKDGPGVPPLEERRNRARAEFKGLDTNGDGFVDRAEAEAVVHSEFNVYDTDRNNKITEPELRLVVARELKQQEMERQQLEARKRQGLMTISEFIDMQLRDADRLDKNSDGKITRDEFIAATAGPPDGPQAQGLPPYELRKQLALRRFQEVDTNKDGVLDRVELTAHAITLFQEMDANKDHFLNAEEFKKAQETEQAKLKAIIQTLQPAQPPRPASPQPRPAPAAPQAAPPGLAPGLPQSRQ